MNKPEIVAITISKAAYTEIVHALQRAGGRGRARFGVIDMQGMLIGAGLPAGGLPTYPSEDRGVVQINSAEALTTPGMPAVKRTEREKAEDDGRLFGVGFLKFTPEGEKHVAPWLVTIKRNGSSSQINQEIAALMEAEERLLYRMLRAWDFESWGEPAYYKHRQESLAMGLGFQPKLVSEIVGLAQVSVQEGQFVPLLVKAEDHLEDGPIDIAERDTLLGRVLAERAKRTPTA